MLFFFDESGSFGVPSPGVHSCSVVCAVVVPDTLSESLQAHFKRFVANLPEDEKKGGEPKGFLLSDQSRHHFCSLMEEHRGVLITPTTLDLTWHGDEQDHPLSASMKASLLEKAQLCVHDTMRNQTEELARQWGNLSENQALRLVALTHCVWEGIKHSVIFHSAHEYHTCWKSLSFFIDAVQNKPLSRERRVFQIMVLMWLCAWSKDDPLVTIEEIHKEDHPFVERYFTDTGVDMGAILRGNIVFANSRDSWGLQLADICANIIYQAVHDLSNYRNRLPLFRQLMRNCPYGPARGGPGLITVTGPTERAAPKYSLLYRAMHGGRKGAGKKGRFYFSDELKKGGFWVRPLAW